MIPHEGSNMSNNIESGNWNEYNLNPFNEDSLKGTSSANNQ